MKKTTVKKPKPTIFTGSLHAEKVRDPTWSNGWLMMASGWRDIKRANKTVGNVLVDHGGTVRVELPNGQAWHIRPTALFEFVEASLRNSYKS